MIPEFFSLTKASAEPVFPALPVRPFHCSNINGTQTLNYKYFDGKRVHNERRSVRLPIRWT
jgi:hypothetical protein